MTSKKKLRYDNDNNNNNDNDNGNDNDNDKRTLTPKNNQFLTKRSAAMPDIIII